MIQIRGGFYIKTIGIYTGAVALCIAILTWVMNLWDCNLNVPFAYAGDAIFTATFIKSMIQNGWYLNNDFLGAPFGLGLQDFPMSDNFHFFVMKLISLIIPNYAVTLNLYFLMTFPLTTLTSLFVLRYFRISDLVAIVISLLYTFLPYHLLRGEGHLFLAAYYMIPLMIMIVLWVYLEPDLVFSSNSNNKFKISLLKKKFLVSVVVALLVSSSGVYYAFFGCFFLIMAGIAAAVCHRKISPLITSIILILVISFGVIANILPSIIYTSQNGRNPQTAIRSPIEAEIYGMKIVQLIMPTPGHRVPYLNNKTSSYIQKEPLVNENITSSLGIIGSIGFITLICIVFFSNKKNNDIISILSQLNVSAILLATIGGFGSLFAMIISPQIRAYNRISVYVAFFSLFAVGILLDKFYHKYAHSKGKKLACYTAITLILFIGIFDQATKNCIPNYAQLKSEYMNDAQFINRVEKVLPRNAMIFQLPYAQFPENPPVNNMGDYELFRGYLHSSEIRWSYGAMKGREGDLWQKQIVDGKLDDFVEKINLAGFSGIYIDRSGYSDNGIEMVDKLERLLDVQPIESINKRLVFFNMVEYNQLIRRKWTDEEWKRKQDLTLHPLVLQWGNGFWGLEGQADSNWRWSSSKGELYVYNYSKQEKKATIKMTPRTGYPEVSTLAINSDFFSANIPINEIANHFEQEIIIPPGRHIIKFLCDAKKINAPNDLRNLVFRIDNFELTVKE